MLLPLDDVRRFTWDNVMGCLRESIPTLSRSALHRRLVRHGISQLRRRGGQLKAQDVQRDQDRLRSHRQLSTPISRGCPAHAVWRTPSQTILDAYKADPSLFKIESSNLR